MGALRHGTRRVCVTYALLGGLIWPALTSPPAFAHPMAATPSAINETQGAENGLGTSHRFASQPAAAAHCPGDTVVWSSSPDLLYTLPSSPDFGHGAGFYACKAEADDAGFQPQGH